DPGRMHRDGEALPPKMSEARIGCLEEIDAEMAPVVVWERLTAFVREFDEHRDLRDREAFGLSVVRPGVTVSRAAGLGARLRRVHRPERIAEIKERRAVGVYEVAPGRTDFDVTAVVAVGGRLPRARRAD